MKMRTPTSGLAVMHWGFASLLAQARDQLSEREYREFLELATRRVAAENARVSPFRLGRAA